VDLWIQALESRFAAGTGAIARVKSDRLLAGEPAKLLAELQEYAKNFLADARDGDGRELNRLRSGLANLKRDSFTAALRAGY